MKAIKEFVNFIAEDVIDSATLAHKVEKRVKDIVNKVVKQTTDVYERQKILTQRANEELKKATSFEKGSKEYKYHTDVSKYLLRNSPLATAAKTSGRMLKKGVKYGAIGTVGVAGVTTAGYALNKYIKKRKGKSNESN